MKIQRQKKSISNNQQQETKDNHTDILVSCFDTIMKNLKHGKISQWEEQMKEN